MNCYSGDVYNIDPSTVRFDDKYVVFNPLHTKEQYEATKMNIEEVGQIDPIIMSYDGSLCYDGRHRVQICKDLGIMVKCICLREGLSQDEILMVCNKNVMSGRDYTNTQKAIQALTLVNTYSMTQVKASALMKVDKRLVTYAATLRGLGKEAELQKLMKDEPVQLSNMERPTKSLEVLCKYAKAASEVSVVEDVSERVMFDPDAQIKTEAGKAWYYSRIEMDSVPESALGIRLCYIELANYKFKMASTLDTTTTTNDNVMEAQ